MYRLLSTSATMKFEFSLARLKHKYNLHNAPAPRVGHLSLSILTRVQQTSKFGLFTTGNAVAEKKVDILFSFRFANYLDAHNL